MKKLISFSIALLSVINIFSQELKYDDLKVDANGRHQYSGEPLITSYVSKDGTVYKVGRKIRIGVPSANKKFAYIMNGGVGAALTGLEPEPVRNEASNSEAVIKTIFIKGNRRTGFYATIQTKGISTYDIQVEKAIQSGEIKSSWMTRDEALSELKRNNDMLDSGLITQQKYDSLKAIFSISVNPQRKSKFTKEQLNYSLVKANQLKTTGAVITLSGCVLDITGIVLIATAPVIGQDWGYFRFGYYNKYDWRGGWSVLLAGVGFTAAGIPLWSTGATKKRHIKAALTKFEGSASINGIGLKISF